MLSMYHALYPQQVKYVFIWLRLCISNKTKITLFENRVLFILYSVSTVALTYIYFKMEQYIAHIDTSIALALRLHVLCTAWNATLGKYVVKMHAKKLVDR